MSTSALQNRGFSLLEVLVALGILAMSLGVIYRAQMNGISSAARAMSVQSAALHAQSLMAESVGPFVDAKVQGGVTPDGFHWRVTREIVTLPALTSGAPEIKLLQTDIYIGLQQGKSQSVFTTFSAP